MTLDAYSTVEPHCFKLSGETPKLVEKKKEAYPMLQTEGQSQGTLFCIQNNGESEITKFRVYVLKGAYCNVFYNHDG